MYPTRPSLRALLVSSLLFPVAWGLKGDSACRRAVCVAATIEDDVVTYEVAQMKDATGWVAIGFGQHMLYTHSVVLWKNADGTTTMSQRYAKDFNEPRPVDNPPRIAKLVEPLKLLAHPENTHSFAFQVPANKSLLASHDPIEHIIFAQAPKTPDKDPGSTIAPHHNVGYFRLDLTKEFAPPGSSTTKQPPPHDHHSHSHGKDKGKGKAGNQVTTGTNEAYKKFEKLIILHGFLASVGFLVLLPAGSLIARYGRAFTMRWFKIHWYSNFAFAGPVITLGVLLGPAVVNAKASFRTHFANKHEIFGIVLLLLYYFQSFLGRYIHMRRNELAKEGPITRPHPPLNILHIILGISIIFLSFLQVNSGLEWWETLTGRGPITPWAKPLFHIWSLVLPLAYFGGYALLPRQFRLERDAATGAGDGPQYARIPLVQSRSNSDTSVLGEDEVREQNRGLLHAQEEEFDQEVYREDNTKSSMEAGRAGGRGMYSNVV